MTKFITVQDDVQKEKKETVFTHHLSVYTGWSVTGLNTNDFEKIIYLGKCSNDGDMFACYGKESINICKGIKGDEFND